MRGGAQGIVLTWEALGYLTEVLGSHGGLLSGRVTATKRHHGTYPCRIGSRKPIRRPEYLPRGRETGLHEGRGHGDKREIEMRTQRQ